MRRSSLLGLFVLGLLPGSPTPGAETANAPADVRQVARGHNTFALKLSY